MSLRIYNAILSEEDIQIAKKEVLWKKVFLVFLCIVIPFVLVFFVIEGLPEVLEKSNHLPLLVIPVILLMVYAVYGLYKSILESKEKIEKREGLHWEGIVKDIKPERARSGEASVNHRVFMGERSIVFSKFEKPEIQVGDRICIVALSDDDPYSYPTYLKHYKISEENPKPWEKDGSVRLEELVKEH